MENREMEDLEKPSKKLIQYLELEQKEIVNCQSCNQKFIRRIRHTMTIYCSMDCCNYEEMRGGK